MVTKGTTQIIQIDTLHNLTFHYWVTAARNTLINIINKIGNM